MRGLPAPGLILLCAACAQADVAPDADVDGPPAPDAPPPDAPPPDAETGTGFFLDDTSEDFAAGALDGAVVEPWGAVAPRAYYTGGLRVRGSDTGVFADAAAATWAQIEAMTFTPASAPARGLAFDWGAAIPAGVGLTGGDDLTLAYDGEIFLEAGTWMFHVLADDRAFLELAPAAGGAFSRVVSATWSTETSGGYVAATTGWHPIRIAHGEQTGGASLRVEATPPGGTRAPVPRHRLRFVASGMTGLVVAGFDDSRLLGGHHVGIDRAAPAARTWNASAPLDLGLTDQDHFSVRWSGQLRIDEDGDYVLRYVSDDGQRLWVDGVRVIDAFDDAAHDTSTAPIRLEPGWHELVVDVSEATGSAQAHLGVASGPDLVGAALPPERLRPVEARGERYDTGVDRTDRAIPDLGQVEATIAIDAPPGAKTRGVDVGWTFEHGYHGDLELSLIAPDGSVHVVRDHAGGGASGTVTERVHVTGLDETIASGVWRLRVRDTVSLDAGTLRDVQLTVHHRAGTPPITAAAAYESSVKDLGERVTEYQALSWRARLAPGTAVRVYARSGDTADDVLAAPWSSPLIDPDGGAPPVLPRRYFQYRIELDSDGDGSAIVDWVRLDTREVIP